MKKIIITFLIVVLLIANAAAGPSLGFSTGSDSLVSWTVSNNGGTYTMSFANIEVDTTSYAGDMVLNDNILMPDMTITNIQKNSLGLIQADLVPAAGSQLVIIADSGPSAGTAVMTSEVGTGGMLTLGKSWMAYSQDQDDLNINSSLAGYSDIIDDFAKADSYGMNVDLSFTGDSASSLYLMLDRNLTGSISGTLSGQIAANSIPHTPAPAAIMLGSLGLLLVGWLRTHKKF